MVIARYFMFMVQNTTCVWCPWRKAWNQILVFANFEIIILKLSMLVKMGVSRLVFLPVLNISKFEWLFQVYLSKSSTLPHFWRHCWLMNIRVSDMQREFEKYVKTWDCIEMSTVNQVFIFPNTNLNACLSTLIL